MRGFCHILACADGYHTSLFDILFCVDESFAALIDRVVVCQIEVSEAVLVQSVEPFWFGSEDELFEDGCLNLCCRTFEIAHDDLSLTEHGVDTIRKEMVDPVTVDDLAYAPVEKNITSEKDRESGACTRGQSLCAS